MTSSFQLVPFDIPEYLITYLANSIGTSVITIEEKKVLPIHRYSAIERCILRSVTSRKKHEVIPEAEFYLLINNRVGDRMKTILGRDHDLVIDEKTKDNLVDLIQSNFDSSLVCYVDGANFAHKKNGWENSSKKSGITVTSILEFLHKNEVVFSDSQVETFKKRYQRFKKSDKPLNNMSLKKVSALLSYKSAFLTLLLGFPSVFVDLQKIFF